MQHSPDECSSRPRPVRLEAPSALAGICYLLGGQQASHTGGLLIGGAS